MSGARLGFFTRLLDAGTDGERYRKALAQVRAAERHGFASVWVAQHHFDRDRADCRRRSPSWRLRRRRPNTSPSAPAS